MNPSLVQNRMAVNEECGGDTRDDELVSLSYDGEEFQIPKELLENVSPPQGGR